MFKIPCVESFGDFFFPLDISFKSCVEFTTLAMLYLIQVTKEVVLANHTAHHH